MNIYEKMQSARCELQDMKLKKSGENKFAGFKYYELGDFLPAINNLLNKHKLFSIINFTDEIATLTIVNSEKVDETVTFTSPVGSLSLKGCNDIQNLGGTQTYLRRYLYMNAFEIIENDEFDAVVGKEGKAAPTKISDAQVKRLFAIAKAKGVSNEDVAKVIKSYGVTEAKDLNKDIYNEIIKRLENK